MGFFRKGGLMIVCVLAIILILLGNTFLTLGLSLRYDNIHNELLPVAEKIAFENANISEKLDSDFSLISEEYCDNYENFTFTQNEFNVVIPCEVVQNGSEAFISYGVEAFVNEAYYKEYDCEFWDCVSESVLNSEAPIVLVSEKSKDYWMGKFYLTFFLFLVSAGLIFFIVEEKTNSFVLLGIFLVVASLPFLFLSKILSPFFDQIYLELFTALFSNSHTVFLISIISGLILFGLGLGFKLGNFGYIISKKFERKKK
ncbi:MAG: hypothetical protein Q8P15_01675 [Nanoarchaeota archaeon]|nr:hypothetical protein [Nanoarchaeota archaeon]